MGLILGLLGRVPILVWPLIAALGWGGVGHLELHHERAARAAEHQAQAEAIAREQARAAAIEAAAKEKIDAQQTVFDTSLGSTDARLRAALARLRNSPGPRRSDVPGAPASAADDGPGSRLPDTTRADLERESARANVLRAGLARCQAWIKTVKTGQKLPD